MNPRWPEGMQMLYKKRLTAGNLVLAFGMRSLDNECSPYGVPSAAAPLFCCRIFAYFVEFYSP